MGTVVCTPAITSSVFFLLFSVVFFAHCAADQNQVRFGGNQHRVACLVSCNPNCSVSCRSVVADRASLKAATVLGYSMGSIAE